MTLTFLGTRGNIDIRSRRHFRHTATMVAHHRARIMIDCGADWLRAAARLQPSAIVVTHAHPDHADGLARGAPCPVYASEHAWEKMRRWPIREARVLRPRTPTKIQGVSFEAFPVEHSIGTPAVGYRVACGRVTIFYVPDVLAIPDLDEAFAGIALYVGDGATPVRPIVRRRDGVAIGHASVATQIEWCASEGVPRAIFTHCGTAVVRGGRSVEDRVERLGLAHGVAAEVAWDGRRVNPGRRW